MPHANTFSNCKQTSKKYSFRSDGEISHAISSNFFFLKMIRALIMSIIGATFVNKHQKIFYFAQIAG